MSVHRPIPREISEALEATGRPYELDYSKPRVHVRVDGRLVGSFNKKGLMSEVDIGHGRRNLVAQLHRIASPPETRVRPAPAPRAKKAPPKPRPAAAVAVDPPLPQPVSWEKGMRLVGEPGWEGLFTRAQIAGGIPNGARVVKVRGGLGEASWLGTRGTVLGSARNPQTGAPVYFVEWDDKPRVVWACMGRKIEALKP